jgi:hypothetical protein
MASHQRRLRVTNPNANRNGHANSNADGNPHGNSNGHANSDSNGYTNSDTNSHTDSASYADAYPKRAASADARTQRDASGHAAASTLEGNALTSLFCRHSRVSRVPAGYPDGLSFCLPGPSAAENYKGSPFLTF